MAEDKDQREHEVAEDLDELPNIEGADTPDAEPHEGMDTPEEVSGEVSGGTSGETSGGGGDLLSRVQQERDELEQRLMRIAADYENYKKRALRNVTEAEEQAIMNVGRGLVTVMDHFDRALDVDEAKANTKDVLAGLKIVHDELLTALSRLGITRVEAQPGEPFDPNHHEALMRTEAEGIETDHVVQQFQPGYAIKDKTIRPAQVSVAS